MNDYANAIVMSRRTLRDRIGDWLLLDIELKEFIFVALSFCDAKLTSLCLMLGGFEAIPWMRGWGDDTAWRMVVALAIILYLKMRGGTQLLWFGNLILFGIVIWNCCMLLILSFWNI